MEDPTIKKSLTVHREFPWWAKFFTEHGERLIFALLALIMAGIYAMLNKLFPAMPGEVKAIIIGIAMLFYNKVRSPKNGNPPKPIP